MDAGDSKELLRQRIDFALHGERDVADFMERTLRYQRMHNWLLSAIVLLTVADMAVTWFK